MGPSPPRFKSGRGISWLRCRKTAPHLGRAPGKSKRELWARASPKWDRNGRVSARRTGGRGTPAPPWAGSVRESGGAGPHRASAGAWTSVRAGFRYGTGWARSVSGAECSKKKIPSIALVPQRTAFTRGGSSLLQASVLHSSPSRPAAEPRPSNQASAGDVRQVQEALSTGCPYWMTRPRTITHSTFSSTVTSLVGSPLTAMISAE